jgi:hypothetical protein
MHKQIIHFGQDPHKPEFYNLIVKVSDINSAELSNETRDELFQRGFTIYHSDEVTIEACFKHRYMGTLNKYRELHKMSWNIKERKYEI